MRPVASDASGDSVERDECWFVACNRPPEGRLRDSEGFTVTTCEPCAEDATSMGWSAFDPFDGEDTDARGGA